jgi:hypothetical protein
MHSDNLRMPAYIRYFPAVSFLRNILFFIEPFFAEAVYAIK